MLQTMYKLYQHFYEKQTFPALEKSITENHKILSEQLSKQNRKMVLRIIDAKDMICEIKTQDAFLQGFKLGTALTTENQIYNDHRFEQDTLENCGRIFMPQNEN